MTELALHFYHFFKRLDPKAGETVWQSAAFLVGLSQDGHSCLPLALYARQPLFDESLPGVPELTMPTLEEWRQRLLESTLVDRPDSSAPLIIDEADRLYLGRNYDYENRLVDEIAQRVRQVSSYDLNAVAQALQTLFGAKSVAEIDWQRIAVAASALHRFLIVSGGPGTGKTYTVANILALLQILEPDKTIRFGLATPTGKAAGRLQESIIASLQKLPSELTSRLDTRFEAMTIHRLLGAKRHSPYFRHDKQSPLALDVLIVDEVSMVDLALMVKLLEAMPASGRVILLGDKDQLSSVESGRVLADICGGQGNGFSVDFLAKLVAIGAVPEGALAEGRDDNPMQDCVVILEKSYRFDETSLIGRLARAVLAGNGQEVSRFLAGSKAVIENPAARRADLAEQVISGFRTYLKEKEPVKALHALQEFRVLCAHRHGTWGVVQINQWIETVLARQKLLDMQSEWYAGKPIMITGNHYSMGLYNGDIGLTLYGEDGQLRVWFEEKNGQLRSYSPSRIPAHETAYAMTVHKSQGSEFSHIVLVLPESTSKLITRELLYTAITRAKRSFQLWGNMDVFCDGVQRTIRRNTGLSEKLKR